MAATIMANQAATDSASPPSSAPSRGKRVVGSGGLPDSFDLRDAEDRERVANLILDADTADDRGIERERNALLKPCAGCGGTAIIRYLSSMKKVGNVGECQHCKRQSVPRAAIGYAVNEWNDRGRFGQ